ncbi:MAG: peptidylprolyl isomerase [Muribaculaceae bacterium]
MKIKITIIALLCGAAMQLSAQNNIAEEVAWVVGDEPIYKSDIEEQYMQMQYERQPIDGNPYCVIPERIAIEKLFLHQAKIDTVKVQDAMVIQQADSRINYFIANLGSKEKVEEYFRKPLPELKEQMIEVIRNQYTIQEVQRNLTKDVKATPADVRKYFSSLSADSVPYIPQQVEVQMLSLNPVIPQQEIDDVKARLRDYTNKINSGESEFSTLAILYSEDGSSLYGGEIGFKSRSELVPEFASVAFNLNDPKKVSKIVETEFGYHIIQLIEKRGDRINCRHILLRPKVAEKDLVDATARLDSIRKDILDKKFTFEDATQFISQDKNTKNNRGIMVNQRSGSTKFEMADLPQEMAKVVDKMQVGDVSEPFVMIDQSRNKEIVVIAKLTRRIPGHKANLSEDYQTLKSMYENSRRAKIIDDWVEKKQRETFVRVEEGWRNCEFKYDGWLKK